MALLSAVNLSLSLKYPTKLIGYITGEKWFESKRYDDGAEGLWRVHNGLYDVSDFVRSHPGGPSWLETTKGTDITEAFEAHHITPSAEQILKKYFVRNAKTERNYPFTFEEDGFYRTLKRNLQPVLKEIPKSTMRTTNLTIDALLVATFFTAVCAGALSSFTIGAISGALLTLTTIAAHNYFHRRDNFRMYYFNLCLMDFREWRLTHSLSHHLFVNTINDLEMTLWLLFAVHFPVKKSFFFKFRSIFSMVFLWTTLYIVSYLMKILSIVKLKKIYLSDLIPFTIPLAMYLMSGQNLLVVLKMWLFIVTVGSFIFGVIGFSASHHHPDVFHEGDAPRGKKVDWAVHQLDTCYDRHEIKDNYFWVLTMFGDHALHHIFPTIDHTALQYMYPVFEKTLKEFGLDRHVRKQTEMFVGQFKQLVREDPNPVPPGSKKR